MGKFKDLEHTEIEDEPEYVYTDEVPDWFKRCVPYTPAEQVLKEWNVYQGWASDGYTKDWIFQRMGLIDPSE